MSLAVAAPSCTIPGCDRPLRSTGMCNAHRQRAASGNTRAGTPVRQAYSDAPPEVRFWDYVDKTESCWLWTGYVKTAGYGQFNVCHGRTALAHRYSYELLVGPIPAGLTIDHLCKVRRCVNPDHMEPVTAGENALRGDGPAALAARRDTCGKGHPYTPQTTRIEDDHRRCLTCRREQRAGDDRQHPRVADAQGRPDRPQ